MCGIFVDDLAKRRGGLRFKNFIAIELQDPVRSRETKGSVAGPCKIVTPSKMANPCAKRLGNLHRRIGRTSVNDHHLVNPRHGTRKASFQVRCLVTHDHHQGNALTRCRGNPRTEASADQPGCISRRHGHAWDASSTWSVGGSRSNRAIDRAFAPSSADPAASSASARSS